MTGAERQARYRKRLRKSINRRARTAYKLATEKARKKASREASAARRLALRSALELPDGIDLRRGAYDVAMADIADASIPLILTNPLCDEEGMRWLARFAARTLIPGGTLICYGDQATLPRDLKLFGEHLRYWWQGCLCLNFEVRRDEAGVRSGYRPILWFGKGRRRDRRYVSDVMHLGAAIWPWIEALTDPGETIERDL
jgi:hypothetical protein